MSNCPLGLCPSWTALNEAIRLSVHNKIPVKEAEKHHRPPALTPSLSFASAASHDNASLGAMEVRMKALEAKFPTMEANHPRNQTRYSQIDNFRYKTLRGNPEF